MLLLLRMCSLPTPFLQGLGGMSFCPGTRVAAGWRRNTELPQRDCRRSAPRRLDGPPAHRGVWPARQRRSRGEWVGCSPGRRPTRPVPGKRGMHSAPWLFRSSRRDVHRAGASRLRLVPAVPRVYREPRHLAQRCGCGRGPDRCRKERRHPVARRAQIRIGRAFCWTIDYGRVVVGISTGVSRTALGYTCMITDAGGQRCTEWTCKVIKALQLQRRSAPGRRGFGYQGRSREARIRGD